VAHRVGFRQRLLDRSNGKPGWASKQALRKAIRALRQKIEDGPHNQRIVVHEAGFGYRLVETSPHAGRIKTPNGGQFQGPYGND